MTLLLLLFWMIMLYGIIALIFKFVKVNRQVPTGNMGTNNRPMVRNELVPILKLPFAISAFVVGLFFVILLSLIIKIGPQDVGVVVTPNGVKTNELHTGWHVVPPWNDIHKMDKTVWVYTCAHAAKEGSKPNSDAIWAPTKDGIKMGFDVSVSWRIDPNEASWIYQNVTENDGGNSGRYLWLEENVIRPKLKSAMALTVSNYTPIEAYSYKRQNIQNDIVLRISNECKQYKLIIDNVDVREVYYNTDFEKAINNKKLQEQQVLTLIEITKQKEEELKQAKINKDIAIQKSEGEAKALQIKGSAIVSNPKIIELEWIQKWDGELPQYMMGSGQGVMINLGKP
jgi:regulator of protease activity HflC (stomatin/prohibitin superfamily)